MNLTEQLNIPSPLHRVNVSWADEANVALWMKRDDLIHPIISGNKWRKLSGVLSSVDDSSFDEIATFGGTYSNHLIATACTAAIMGKKSRGIIRGEKPKELNKVLILCELYGMKLEFVSRSYYKEINRKEGLDKDTMWIPEGGAGPRGMIGCREIITELEAEKFSKLFVSCGTGTTLAGLVQANADANMELFGVQVLKGDGYIRDEVMRMTNREDFQVLDHYHHGGYAKTSKELINFIKDFTKQTGVLLDPIYTGKMMHAIKDQIKFGKIESGEKILAVHTGGLTGWFGKMNELSN